MALRTNFQILLFGCTNRCLRATLGPYHDNPKRHVSVMSAEQDVDFRINNLDFYISSGQNYDRFHAMLIRVVPYRL